MECLVCKNPNKNDASTCEWCGNQLTIQQKEPFFAKIKKIFSILAEKISIIKKHLLTFISNLSINSVGLTQATFTKYIILISQSKTAEPTVIELENTIGPIVWERKDKGTYIGTLLGSFTEGKTYAMINNVKPYGIVSIETNINFIQITTTKLDSPSTTLHDNLLDYNSIEIRVYK